MHVTAQSEPFVSQDGSNESDMSLISVMNDDLIPGIEYYIIRISTSSLVNCFLSFLLYSGDLVDRLNDFYPGDTVPFGDLSDLIMNSRMENDVYELQLNNRISDLYESRILVGQLSNLNQIITVELDFYNDNGGLVLDPSGMPIQYRSSPRDLGHVLDILHQGFEFSYATCRLTLQPHSSFNPHSLFFHFAQNSSSVTPHSTKQLIRKAVVNHKSYNMF